MKIRNNFGSALLSPNGHSNSMMVGTNRANMRNTNGSGMLSIATDENQTVDSRRPFYQDDTSDR